MKNTVRELIDAYLRMENSMDSEDFPYVSGAIRYDFSSKARQAITVAPGRELYRPPFKRETLAYEDNLVAFFSSALENKSIKLGRLLMLCGGTGSGKSTAVREAIRRARRKHGRRINIIYIDFNSWREVNLAGSGSPDQRSQLWNLIARQFMERTPESLNSEEEVSRYWPWLLKHGHLLAHINGLFQFLETVRNKIVSDTDYGGQTRAEIIQDLIKEREKRIAELDGESYGWYQIGRYFFSATKEIVGPEVIFVFDNVDHAEPWVQGVIHGCLNTLLEALRVNILVVMRPHTIELFHGHKMHEVEDHLAPPIIDVIVSRLRLATDKLDEAEKKIALQYIIDDLERRKSWILHALIEGTAGINVRAGIRNFLNLFSCPTITGLPLEKLARKNFGLDTSELARSFFFSDGTQIDERNIVNLYRCGGPMHSSSFFVKWRILDFVGRICGGEAKQSYLIDYLKKFGYDLETILLGVNTLLSRRRALLWAEANFRVDEKTPDQRIRMTPMGYTYAYYFCGEYFYVESCFAYDRNERIDPDILREQFDQICEVEFDEIRRFVKNESGLLYRRYFPAGLECLSLIHLKEFKRGIIKRVQFFDNKKENMIAQRVERILFDR